MELRRYGKVQGPIVGKWLHGARRCQIVQPVSFRSQSHLHRAQFTLTLLLHIKGEGISEYSRETPRRQTRHGGR